MKIPESSWRLLRILARQAQSRRLPIYAVGGCVRDWILKRPTSDLDLVVEGDPSFLARFCAKRLGTEARPFGRFGTWRVAKKGGLRVDFAASRRESYPKPACLPEVERAPLQEDLFRRDFTINAMAVPLLEQGPGELIDIYGGRADLKAGVLRALHLLSFRDDPTRVFRAARFLCRFDLKPAPGLAAMAVSALQEGHAALLSRHRLLQELMKILSEEKPECALRKARQWGYLRLIGPKLNWRPTKLQSSEERLAGVLLSLGPSEGKKLLASLPLDRAFSRTLKEILDVSRARMSPRRPLPAMSRRVLSEALGPLAPAALKPRLIGGRDLQGLGLPPGSNYREILDDAARKQWTGKLPSRKFARAWLKKRFAAFSTNLCISKGLMT